MIYQVLQNQCSNPKREWMPLKLSEIKTREHSRQNHDPKRFLRWRGIKLANRGGASKKFSVFLTILLLPISLCAASIEGYAGRVSYAPGENVTPRLQHRPEIFRRIHSPRRETDLRLEDGKHRRHGPSHSRKRLFAGLQLAVRDQRPHSRRLEIGILPCHLERTRIREFYLLLCPPRITRHHRSSPHPSPTLHQHLQRLQ